MTNFILQHKVLTLMHARVLLSMTTFEFLIIKFLSFSNYYKNIWAKFRGLEETFTLVEISFLKTGPMQTVWSKKTDLRVLS